MTSKRGRKRGEGLSVFTRAAEAVWTGRINECAVELKASALHRNQGLLAEHMDE